MSVATLNSNFYIISLERSLVNTFSEKVFDFHRSFTLSFDSFIIISHSFTLVNDFLSIWRVAQSEAVFSVFIYNLCAINIFFTHLVQIITPEIPAPGSTITYNAVFFTKSSWQSAIIL